VASIESSNRASVAPDLTASRRRAGLAGILTWQSAALVVLLLGVAIEQPAFDVAGLTVKPEQVAILALWALVGWRVIGTGLLRGARLLLWTVPYCVVLLAASLLNAPDREAALRHTGLVILVTSAAWLAYGLVDTQARLALAMRWLIVLALAEAVLTLGVLAFAWSWVPPGAQSGLGGIAVPNGTLWEPNLLGSYLAAGGVLALGALLAAGSRRWAFVLAGGLAVIITALGLSLARAAWLGFAVGAVVLCIGFVALRGRCIQLPGSARRNIALAVLAAALAGVFLVGVAPVIFPGTAGGFRNRVALGSYDPQTDPSLQARAGTLQQAVPGIASHPILGNGTGSFGSAYVDSKGNPGWVANLELHVLYDSGLVGLACWLVGLGALFWVGVSRLRRSAGAPPALQQQILALIAALTGLLVAFQATEGSWLAFPWIYVGLLAAGLSIASAGVGVDTSEPGLPRA
jgi:O-antigen ligase